MRISTQCHDAAMFLTCEAFSCFQPPAKTSGEDGGQPGISNLAESCIRTYIEFRVLGVLGVLGV